MRFIVFVISLLLFCSCKQEQKVTNETTAEKKSLEVKTESQDTVVLVGKSLEQLRLIRNEIFARHGFVFKSKDLSEHFNGQDWYKPNPNFSIEDLSSEEKDLVARIRKKEKEIDLNTQLEEIKTVLRNIKKGFDSKDAELVSNSFKFPMKNGAGYCFYSYNLLEEIAVEDGPLDLNTFKDYFEESMDSKNKESIYAILNVLNIDNLTSKKTIEKEVKTKNGSLVYHLSIGENVIFKIFTNETINEDGDIYEIESMILYSFAFENGKLVFQETLAAG